MTQKKNSSGSDHKNNEGQSNAPEEVPAVDTALANEQTKDNEPKDNGTAPAEEQLSAELAEANNKYLRLYAEFDNYKRRVAKERMELIQTAGKDIMASLLPLIDDFERALKAMETATEINAIKEGIGLVSQKFNNTLAQQGLKPMETIGKPFDAEFQEAITSIPAPTDEQKGMVIDEVEKGYYLHDKVLRYAKVVVGN